MKMFHFIWKMEVSTVFMITYIWNGTRL